LNIIS